MQALRLKEQIASRFGLRPQERWEHELGPALAALARRHGLPERQLDRALAADPQLLRELAGLLTIEETFFFRFPEQLSAAVRHLGERWWCAPAEGFVVWSAGCSTGEEPYSLAIGLNDAFGPLAQRCRLVACDISADAIARARAAVYGSWSFRGVAPALRERCFVRVDGGRFRLHDVYRKAVQFAHLSVQEYAASLPERAVQVVLFRNVGVYLDAAALERCHEAFARVLRQDGLLIQAATDPTPPSSLFVRGEGLPVGLYQRPAAETVPAPPACPRPRPPSLPPPAPGRPASLCPPPHVDALLLGDRGQLEQALAEADRVVRAEPASPAGLVLRAQIHLAAERAPEAVEDLRRALFLSPESWLTRYWYVLALRSAQQAERAEAQLRELTRQLARLPDTALLEDGVTEAGELRSALAALSAAYH